MSYYEDVSGIAEDATQEAKDNCDDSMEVNEFAIEFVHQSVDSHLTYTRDAYMALMESSNPDEGIESGGVDLGSCDSASQVVTQLAFYAMYQDVMDKIKFHEIEDYFDTPVYTCDNDDCGESFTQKQCDDNVADMGDKCPECGKGTLE
jgi:hypothetical protein